ncbi:hypothetical protein Bbelb_218130 [Branchiostoma belcheri]|nr:hypothetical protein Bbelb_218130 [Branchiostoma belcheri]
MLAGVVRTRFRAQCGHSLTECGRTVSLVTGRRAAASEAPPHVRSVSGVDFCVYTTYGSVTPGRFYLAQIHYTRAKKHAQARFWIVNAYSDPCPGQIYVLDSTQMHVRRVVTEALRLGRVPYDRRTDLTAVTEYYTGDWPGLPSVRCARVFTYTLLDPQDRNETFRTKPNQSTGRGRGRGTIYVKGEGLRGQDLDGKGGEWSNEVYQITGNQAMSPVQVLIIGAGVRGETYAQYALNYSDRLQVVGVADPRLFRCKLLQHLYNIPAENVFTDWQEAAGREKFADCVVIATPDQLHKGPAVAFADRGYHILLEKPMAVTEEDCREIVSACERNNVILSVCHVLRYYPPVQKIKELIDSGAIGDVVNIHHREPVGFWHFAHSFVRGNWRNTTESSFSLLAKCCHDVDLIRYWLSGSRCVKVSSFGSLLHFTPDNKPAGAASRCLDCQVESTCPYSAKKIYVRRVEQGQTGWPVSVVCPKEPVDIESLTEALRTGPYGRCVYDCDNDVVSNQVVNFQFEGGQTACLNMVAFTQEVGERQTRISGTKGELHCSGAGPVYLYDFLTQEETKHDCEAAPSVSVGDMPHGGADFFLMDAFVKAVQSGDQSHIVTGPQDTLHSHLLVFAAEQARLQDRVINIHQDGSYS